MNKPTRFVSEASMNLADTWRDPDHIVVKKIGEYKTLDDAKKEAKKQYFFLGEFHYDKTNDIYIAYEHGSYAATVKIIPKYN